MKGWEILKEWAEKKRALSVTTLYNYARSGYIDPPNGPLNSLQSDYDQSTPAQIYCTRTLLPIIGPSELKMAREIALHVLAAAYEDAWDIAKDPKMLELIKCRTSPAFYAVEWLKLFFEWSGSPPSIDLRTLRIALMSFAEPPPDGLEKQRAEWNAKDIAEMRERNRLEELEDEEEEPKHD